MSCYTEEDFEKLHQSTLKQVENFLDNINILKYIKNSIYLDELMNIIENEYGSQYREQFDLAYSNEEIFDYVSDEEFINYLKQRYNIQSILRYLIL